MTDPLVTKEIRLAVLERLACRLNDLKLCGVRFPANEVKALVNIIVEERRECVQFRKNRAALGHVHAD